MEANVKPLHNMRISLTRNLPNPNIYVKMLADYKGWIFLEEEALLHKGQWAKTFADPSLPLDLEIGCGNGYFFDHRVRSRLQRNLLGIEIKYKPLVQTVRRIKGDNLNNGRGLRFNAHCLEQIFSEGELDNVFIYFPDPWPRLKQQKNRVMRETFFKKLSKLQKPGRYVDIKTDDENYFDFAHSEIQNCPEYKIERFTKDLHKSEWAATNFMTAFERIFIKKGQPIYYMRLINHQ